MLHRPRHPDLQRHFDRRAQWLCLQRWPRVRPSRGAGRRSWRVLVRDHALCVRAADHNGLRRQRYERNHRDLQLHRCARAGGESHALEPSGNRRPGCGDHHDGHRLRRGRQRGHGRRRDGPVHVERLGRVREPHDAASRPRLRRRGRRDLAVRAQLRDDREPIGHRHRWQRLGHHRDRQH